jgi:hypothetical protein
MEESKNSKSFSMFETEKVQRGEEKDIFNIYKEEVRGTDPQTQQVIPMHDLNDYEENKLHEYIAHLDHTT